MREYIYFNKSNRTGLRLLVDNSIIKVQVINVFITFTPINERYCSMCSLYGECRYSSKLNPPCESLHMYLNGAYLKFIEVDKERIIKGLSLFTSLILLKLINKYEKGRFIKIKTGE